MIPLQSLFMWIQYARWPPPQNLVFNIGIKIETAMIESKLCLNGYILCPLQSRHFRWIGNPRWLPLITTHGDTAGDRVPPDVPSRTNTFLSNMQINEQDVKDITILQSLKKFDVMTVSPIKC